jgi:sulfur-oxidizing protein SoxY
VQPTRHVTVLDRRTVLVGGTAVAALMTLLLGQAAAGTAETPPAAEPTPPPPEPISRAPASPGLVHSSQFDAALQAILKDAVPVNGEPLTLDLPELAENGNVVPYKISVENPMTDTDYIRTLHLLSTSNPQAVVATFHLVPASGKAAVAGRMRLARTQDVVAIAEASTGQVLIAIRKVEVTIGGCGNE